MTAARCFVVMLVLMTSATLAGAEERDIAGGFLEGIAASLGAEIVPADRAGFATSDAGFAARDQILDEIANGPAAGDGAVFTDENPESACLRVALEGVMRKIGSESANLDWLGFGGAAEPCVGDCDGNGLVTVAELVSGVNLALGQGTIDTCYPFDGDGNGRVEISELIQAVGNALYGCGVVPPTQVPTRTPTATPTAVPATATTTRTVTRTATRTPEIRSVCGGNVGSAPRLCALSVSPSTLSTGQSIVVEIGTSDLEGDVDQVCIGISLSGTQPVVECESFIPRGTMINEIVRLDPIPITLPAGEYTLSFTMSDQAGHTSNTVSANFRVQGINSVCGGPVTSVPKLCNFTVSPTSVSRFGSITLRYGASDLEGDIYLICIGLALVPFNPVVDCALIVPRGSLINEFLTGDPIPLGGVPAGTYLLAFNVTDRAGNLSNTVSAQFRAY